MNVIFDCPSCSIPIKISAQYLGKSGPCPHCKAPITVPLNAQPEELIQEAPAPLKTVPIQKARIVKKGETGGLGCLVEIIGLLFCFAGIFTVLGIFGVLIGFLIMVVGHTISSSYRCTNCGNVLVDKKVLICPTCHCRLDG